MLRPQLRCKASERCSWVLGWHTPQLFARWLQWCLIILLLILVLLLQLDPRRLVLLAYIAKAYQRLEQVHKGCKVSSSAAHP